MTTRQFIEIDISLLVLAGLIGLSFALFFNRQPKVRKSIALPVVEHFHNPLAASTPTPLPSPTPTTPPQPKVETFVQTSPDGKKTITMTKTSLQDNASYDFTTTDSPSQPIYSVQLIGSDNMSLPFNAWSPDDRYVFIQQNGASGSAAIVLTSTGQPLSSSGQYFNVLEGFLASNTGNTYQETTGWAADNLLIINTKASDGSQGPSYWLGVPELYFTALSTKF